MFMLGLLAHIFWPHVRVTIRPGVPTTCAKELNYLDK